jgi:murein DD-endopeptidase MepM/ murein hydrolase activator NlpD
MGSGTRFRSLLTMALLCAAAVRLYAGPQEQPGVLSPASDRPVQVFSVRDGETINFYVRNAEPCEITMTFQLRLVNLESDQPMPLTGVYPGGEVTRAFSLTPTKATARWRLQHTNYFKLGSYLAQHDNSVVYHLPYLAGNQFKVTQAYDGTFSHQGANRYAIDWKMPEGTPVCAARGGVVVKIKTDSDRGGSSIKYDKDNNYVMIRHDDGTLGHYCHLQKDGATVKAGQRVEAGEVIAHSGNTGFSSGPHLHFAVIKPRNGRERESLPVRFRTLNREAATLVTGESYAAPATAVASERRSVDKDNAAVGGAGSGSPLEERD